MKRCCIRGKTKRDAAMHSPLIKRSKKMEKKYPKKRWMSRFDHVLTIIYIVMVGALMGRGIIQIFLDETPGTGIAVLTGAGVVFSGIFVIAIYLKPREYSYVQLKEDGIYWKSIWGRTYVYFPWEDVK
jgi:hypothetical protein